METLAVGTSVVVLGWGVGRIACRAADDGGRQVYVVTMEWGENVTAMEWVLFDLGPAAARGRAFICAGGHA